MMRTPTMSPASGGATRLTGLLSQVCLAAGCPKVKEAAATSCGNTSNISCLSITGALLGLKSDLQLPTCQEDEEIPGLFHASPGILDLPLNAVAETYLLSKQGKSCRYQLWTYSQVHESNAQLTDFSPKRAADGKVYVVPAEGVQEGLCGKAVLLWPVVPEHTQHQ